MSLKARSLVQITVALCLALMAALQMFSCPASAMTLADDLIPDDSMSQSPAETWPSASDRFLRKVRSYSLSRHCSRNMPCLWAVCDWSVYVTVNSGRCEFIPSGCKCRQGQRCTETKNVSPNKGYLTVTFTCQ